MKPVYIKCPSTCHRALNCDTLVKHCNDVELLSQYESMRYLYNQIHKRGNDVRWCSQCCKILINKSQIAMCKSQKHTKSCMIKKVFTRFDHSDAQKKQTAINIYKEITDFLLTKFQRCEYCLKLKHSGSSSGAGPRSKCDCNPVKTEPNK